MKQALVLDKCFLQSKKKLIIQELATSHRLVMTGALLYELLTCEANVRRGCFIHLPITGNPVELVDHTWILLQFEIKNHKPAGKPTSYKENIQFKFNPRLLELEYTLPHEAQETINEQHKQLQLDIKEFIIQARLIPTYFPTLLEGSDEKRKIARHEAEKEIAAKGGLLPLYKCLKSPNPKTPFPPSNLLDESWTFYRWLQVMLLFGLDIFCKYQGNIPKKFTTREWNKLEHDVLDAQILIIAISEGEAFATKEKKLIRWWNLLLPDGELFQ